LRAYALGLAGYAALKVITPTFYALNDARTPMFVALGSIVVNAGLNYVFGTALGLKAAGLALATSLVALTNFVLLLALMRRRIGRIEASVLVRSLTRIAVATAAMAGAVYGTHRLLEAHRYLDVTGSIVAALIVFGAFCKLLRIDEFGEVLGVLRFGGRNAAQSQSS
jgi:putative peptidoglycan lipid II flippase